MLRIYLPIYIPFLWSFFRWFSSTFWPKEHSSLPQAFQQPQPLPWQSAFAAPDSLASKFLGATWKWRHRPWLSATNQTFQLCAKDLCWEIFFDDRWNLTIHLVWIQLAIQKVRNAFAKSVHVLTFWNKKYIHKNQCANLSAMSSIFGKKRNVYIYIYMNIIHIEREREFHKATKSLK